jgi:hypothetical protein
VRDDAVHAKIGEAPADKGARSLGSVALVPLCLAEAVAQVDAVLDGPEVEPAQELAGAPGLGGPEPEPLVPLVETEAL